MRSLQISFLIAGVLPATGVLARSYPRADRCGVKGYDNGTDAYYYDDSGKYAGYDKCAAHCARDTKCKSLGYDSTGVCMHFDVPVTGNFEADSDSDFTFYDRSCISISTSTTAVITQTTATKTTISTTKAPSANSSTAKTSSSTSSTTSSSTKASSSTSSTTSSSKKASSSASSTTSSSAKTTSVTSSTTGSSTKASSTISSTTTSSSRYTTSSSTTSVQVSTNSSGTKAFSSLSTGTSSTTVSSSSSTTKSSQSTTSTTSKASSIITSTKTTTSSGTSSTKATTALATATAVPSGCNIPPLYKITNFSWFNSSHNLDCSKGPDVGDGTGCLTVDANGQAQWCDPKTDSTCTHCGIGVCMTGLPPQPVGYGPPDDVKFTFADGSSCEQLNPAVVHRYEVGEGFVQCGGSYDFMNFYGSSNAASQTGFVEINGYSVVCDDGDTILPYYNTQFQVDCTRDKQLNATCTTPGSFNIPLVSYNKWKDQSD